MSLRDMQLKLDYRSGIDDIANDFIVPSLKLAKVYKRGVGYFTSDSLINLADGIIGLIRNSGTIRVIASVMLKEEDILAINSGYDIRDDIIIEKLLYQLNLYSDNKSMAKLDVIANLIAAHILEIKIAYKTNGIYHEKIGIIEESQENFLAFTGSLNETQNAFLNNYESIYVFCSWLDGMSSFAKNINDHFELLWSNKVKGLTTIDFPVAVKNDLLKKYKISDDLDTSLTELENLVSKENTNNYDTIDKGFTNRQLYEYQEKAIDELIANNYRHFFEMATGTGKTFTSIRGLKEMINLKKKLFIVIIAPKTDIQEQWYYELKNNSMKNIYAIGGQLESKDWEQDFSKSIIDYSLGESIIYVCVFDSFFSKFINKIKNIEELMIIVDEAHNLSPNQYNKLPSNAKYRLGLSATPERHDVDETNQILDYFIGTNRDTFKYTIEEAIQNGFLSRYNYYPIFVVLTDKEFEEYKKITHSIIILKSLETSTKEDITKKLIERSLIIKKAKNKTTKLRDMLRTGNYDFKNSVVYCGQGKDLDSEEKLINIITKLLYEEAGLKVSTYTSQTVDRHVVLEEFEKGFYDVLVAIKCFDEGIDVPKLDKIYIMSSDRLIRQTIQRRGRVLRKCKETGKSIASIYDFVVLPPPNEEDLPSSKSLVNNELIRVKEYMRLAENKNENLYNIEMLESKYDLRMEEYTYENY